MCGAGERHLPERVGAGERHLPERVGVGRVLSAPHMPVGKEGAGGPAAVPGDGSSALPTLPPGSPGRSSTPGAPQPCPS